MADENRDNEQVEVLYEEETEDTLPPDPAPPKQDKHLRTIIIAIAIVAALAIVGLVATQMINSQKMGDAAMAANQTLQSQIEANANQHQHSWQTQWELVHHDEVNDTVHHDAVTETIMVPHTVCNTCHSIIDGQAQEHIDETGHAGYSTNVSIPEQHIATEAWDETVVVTPAYDELVANTEKCSDCGEIRSIETITKAADTQEEAEQN